jgi:hypothetical protein
MKIEKVCRYFGPSARSSEYEFLSVSLNDLARSSEFESLLIPIYRQFYCKEHILGYYYLLSSYRGSE